MHCGPLSAKILWVLWIITPYGRPRTCVPVRLAVGRPRKPCYISVLWSSRTPYSIHQRPQVQPALPPVL